MSDKSIELIAARYVGDEPVRLVSRRGGYRDGDGKQRTGASALTLVPGDTLLMPATEVLGETLLVTFAATPTSAEPVASVRSLGVGFAPLPEHAGLLRSDLVGVRFLVDKQLSMYEFHDGRSDFEAVDTSSSAEPSVNGASADTAPKRARKAASADTASVDTSSEASSDVSSTLDPASESADATDAAQGA